MPLQQTEFANEILSVIAKDYVAAAYIAFAIHFADTILPSWARILVFGFFNNHVFGYSMIERHFPAKSYSKQHYLLCGVWGVLGGYLAIELVPFFKLTGMFGSFLLFHDVIPNAVKFMKSDDIPNIDLINHAKTMYSFVVFTGVCITLRIICLVSLEAWIRVSDAIICCLSCIGAISLYHLPTAEVVRQGLGYVLLVIERGVYHFFNTKDIVENSLIFYGPRVIRKPWEIRDRVHIELNGVPKFKYQQLSGPRTIRLLQLDRKSFSSGIPRCNIKEFPIDGETLPAYEAVSYRWGNNAKLPKVFIGDRYLPVTESVYELLQSRASFWRSRLIWIDAICINQKDKNEKDTQIQLMREIYEKAHKVIIFPGANRSARLAADMVISFTTCTFVFKVLHWNFTSLPNMTRSLLGGLH
jgi:hypothetical protein